MFLHTLKPLFFHVPVVKFRIIGNSMYPTFKENDVVLVNKLSYFFKNPDVDDIVVIYRKKHCVLKRVKKIKNVNGKFLFFVQGDNKKSSTDSRDFGWIRKDEIIGKVIK